MSAGDAADRLVERTRARPWGLAVAAITDGVVSIRVDAGADPLDEESTFEWGSLTKTMTGVLLAGSIEAGELTAESSLGELLGVTGDAAAITVHELATQRSGLPRLPPNLDVTIVDPRDPYAVYTTSDLREALAATPIGAKEHAYSNFGFMALGTVLAKVTGTSYSALLEDRILAPLGMSSTGCPPPEDRRLPGYTGSEVTPWWSRSVDGAGGVGGPITDLAAYLRAHLDPPDGPLGLAIERATTIQAAAPDPMGFGWVHQSGGWWHNGGTGGFRSFAALHRPTGTAVALLANSAQADVIDGVGFATLTEMIRTVDAQD